VEVSLGYAKEIGAFICFSYRFWESWYY
jgi:hypothetical protein